MLVSRSTSSGLSWAKIGRVGAPRARKPDRFNTVVAEEKLFLTLVGRGPEWRGRRREKVSRRRVERTSGVHEFFTILSSSSVTLLIVA